MNNYQDDPNSARAIARATENASTPAPCPQGQRRKLGEPASEARVGLGSPQIEGIEGIPIPRRMQREYQWFMDRDDPAAAQHCLDQFVAAYKRVMQLRDDIELLAVYGITIDLGGRS